MAADLTPAPRPTRRFVWAYGLLALVIVAAGVGTWLLVDRTERTGAFSSFQPDADDPVDRAQQIADHVAPRYLTTPGGQPLVGVEAGEDDKPALPASPQVLAVGTNPPGLVSYEYGDILFFRMCASGPDCGLGPGDDPALLAPLLARQAMELALYGLRYVPEAAFVVVVLPPGFVAGGDPANPPRAVHFFRRDDLEDELDRPLTDTLPDEVPTPATLTPEQNTAIEARAERTRYTLASGTDAANTLNVYTLTPLF